jgi:membrane protein YdbS with pleckstrin-like domain
MSAGTEAGGHGTDAQGPATATGEPFDPWTVSWSRVSPRLSLARRTSLTITLAVLAVVTAVVGLVVIGWAWSWAILAGIAVAWVWGWVVAGRQVAAIGYAEREDDLLVRRGVMFRELVVVPYGRMQYVDVQAGPLDRAFGIARVQLHTASPGTDASIPGLPPHEAARLRDRLASRGHAQLAGL